MGNSVMEILGAIARYIYHVLTGKFKPFSSFYNPLWGNKNMDDMIENQTINRKIGFIILVVFIFLIYIGVFD